MESIDDKRFLRAIIAVFIVVLVLFLFLLRFLSVKAVDLSFVEVIRMMRGFWKQQHIKNE